MGWGSLHPGSPFPLFQPQLSPSGLGKEQDLGPGATGARSCCSQQEPHPFLLHTSTLGMLVHAVHHPYVCLYIYPCPLPIPVYNSSWPQRSWDHAAISICSRTTQRKRLGNGAGSVQQEHRDRGTRPSVDALRCVEGYSVLKQAQAWWHWCHL